MGACSFGRIVDRRRRLRRRGRDPRGRCRGPPSARAAGPPRCGGRLSGRATLSGDPRAPAASREPRDPTACSWETKAWALSTRPSPGTGDGQVAVDAKCRSPRVDLALRGSIGAGRSLRRRPPPRERRHEPRSLPARRPPGPARAARPDRERPGSGPRARSARPRSLTGEAALSELSVLFPEYPVKSREPVRPRARGRRPAPPGPASRGRGHRPRDRGRGRLCWARPRSRSRPAAPPTFARSPP